jgi:hypothetical protein
VSTSNSKRYKPSSPSARRVFLRKTVTLPDELGAFLEEQTSGPKHAGNFSSYVRNLILEDLEKKSEVTV